ncbi:MAG: hypothetical protein ACOC2U_00490 [bacterium]
MGGKKLKNVGIISYDMDDYHDWLKKNVYIHDLNNHIDTNTNNRDEHLFEHVGTYEKNNDLLFDQIHYHSICKPSDLDSLICLNEIHSTFNALKNPHFLTLYIESVKLMRNDDNDGLYNKYIIKKTNGKPIDPNSDYFVLRLDDGCKDKKHLEASRKALLTYAEEIKDHLPKLSKDLIEKYDLKNQLYESVNDFVRKKVNGSEVTLHGNLLLFNKNHTTLFKINDSDNTFSFSYFLSNELQNDLDIDDNKLFEVLTKVIKDIFGGKDYKILLHVNK